MSGKVGEGNRHGGNVLVAGLVDQLHRHAGQAFSLGPDDPVTVKEANVRRGRFGDGGVGISEYRIVEAAALGDAPSPE
jgi:hypothetical protein